MKTEGRYTRPVSKEPCDNCGDPMNLHIIDKLLKTIRCTISGCSCHGSAELA